LSGSSTCIQQSAPEGFFRNEDCLQFSNFVCEINSNAEFAEPAEGKVWFDYNYTFANNDIYSESYIHSPNYPDDYPNNYEQVMTI